MHRVKEVSQLLKAEKIAIPYYKASPCKMVMGMMKIRTIMVLFTRMVAVYTVRVQIRLLRIASFRATLQMKEAVQAFFALNQADLVVIANLTDQVVNQIISTIETQGTVHVEVVQDIVEEVLMKNGHYKRGQKPHLPGCGGATRKRPVAIKQH